MSGTDSESTKPNVACPADEAKIEIENPVPPVGKVPYWRHILDHAMVTPEVVAWTYPGAGTNDDPFRISWIPNDPRNPHNMTLLRRSFITGLLATITLAAAFMSSTYSGTIDQVVSNLHTNVELATAGLSLYVVGFALGPLLWAPLGEMFGRQVILFISYGAFTAFNAGTIAATNIQTVLIMRFFSGTFGASALTNPAGVIADMFDARQRGVAMSTFAMAPFMGPVFGPIVGGFLGQAAGWRWVQALTALFSGTLWIAATFCVPETYTPLLLRKRAKKLSSMTGKVYVSAIDAGKEIPLGPDGVPRTEKQQKAAELRIALTLPIVLLVRDPIILLFSLYMSILYGILYMLFGAFPIVYQELRGWNEGVGGLAFLGVAVGEMIGCVYCMLDSRRYVKIAKASPDGRAPPEVRLVPSMSGAVAIPVGLFWFAWTNYPSIHWIVSILAGVPFGFGIVVEFISIKTYLVDAYTVFAASAMASTVVLRSLFGASFPLFTTYMFHNLGVHWAASLPAFLALAAAPLPFVFYKWGYDIRMKCKYSKEAEKLAARMVNN